MTLRPSAEHVAKMREIAAERAFQKLVRKLAGEVARLEAMGENDMGLLHASLAGRFHRATAMLRSLTVELTQDAMWPHEPGFPDRR